MITLSTGLPGAGKTLYTISLVKALSEREQRPVFYSGIKDLALPWHEIDAEKWIDCPDGAIIVIDECQRLFRPRGNGAAVPPWVSKLETHRHQGIDLFIVTQHPMLIDANVRRLTERHFHVSRRFGMQRATILEFQSCKDQPLAKLADAQRHQWPYPKEVFSYYKSAELHTVKRRLPVQLFVLVGVLAMTGGAVWYFVRSHYQDGQVLLPGQTVPAKAEPLATGQPSSAKPAADRPLTAAQYVDRYQPRVPGLAHTAPVYDEVTKPIRAPVPLHTAIWRGKCHAFSQQGTALDMPQDMCLAINQRGFFRSFDDKAAPSSSPEPAGRAAAVGSAARSDAGPGAVRVSAPS